MSRRRCCLVLDLLPPVGRRIDEGEARRIAQLVKRRARLEPGEISLEEVDSSGGRGLRYRLVLCGSPYNIPNNMINPQNFARQRGGMPTLQELNEAIRNNSASFASFFARFECDRNGSAAE